MSEDMAYLHLAEGLEKIHFIPLPKKGDINDCANYCTIALIPHASKILLKIIQKRLASYIEYQLSDEQAGFRHNANMR